ncbi:hypothetical protein ACXR6G_06040 [Ancylomarina sp. YFZ004]
MKKINNRSFLLIHSSIHAIFAIGLFFFPKLIWPNYGVQLNDQYSVFLSQHNSIFLGAIAILGFIFRDIENKSIVAQKLFTGLFWTNILGVIITLYACFNQIFIGFGWSDPVFFIVLSVLSYLKLRDNQ